MVRPINDVVGFAAAVATLYPDLVLAHHWSIQDDGDGPYLAEWPEELELPTEQQISAAGDLVRAGEELRGRSAEASAVIAALQEPIALLQDAVDLGLADAEETDRLQELSAALTEWKRYRVLLSRVQTSAGWPSAPAWPPRPNLEISLP